MAGSKKMAAAGSTAIHTINPIEIHQRGSKAVSESIGSILARFKHEGVDYDCNSYVRYVSRLERVDSGWKVTSLEVIYDKDTIIPVSPTTEARHLSVNGGRESYKCLAWVLAQNGFEVDQTLPGSDLPGSVEKLTEAALGWLNEGT